MLDAFETSAPLMLPLLNCLMLEPGTDEELDSDPNSIRGLSRARDSPKVKPQFHEH